MRDEKKYKKYKSDTKTNRPESALSENIKLIDFRTFVHPKIRTKICSKNAYQKSVSKICALEFIKVKKSRFTP